MSSPLCTSNSKVVRALKAIIVSLCNHTKHAGFENELMRLWSKRALCVLDEKTVLVPNHDNDRRVGKKG